MNKLKKTVARVKKQLIADIHELDEAKAKSIDEEVLFSVTKEQAKKMRVFSTKHTSCHCGKELDVSDYESW
jgi:hypothetical protein